MFRRTHLAIAAILTGLLLTSSGSYAQRSAERGGYQSLDSAVSRARQRSNGRVLSAETREVDGRPVHYIRLLTPDGRVKRVRIDARSGRRLGRSKGR